MDTIDITPSTKVWAHEHRLYVIEHIGKSIDRADDLANALALYATTGLTYYWDEAQAIIRSLSENMANGSLKRVRSIAYYVCDICDSDICEHADRYNA